MNKKRIICVGNRFRSEDSAGVMVYDQLVSDKLPKDIEVIDGGLAGLNLLRFIHDADRVVFIDAVNGFIPSGGVIVLDAKDASRHADTTFGHGAGLAYCLRILPEIYNDNLPEIFIVGIEGATDPDIILKAAEMSLDIAARGVSRTDRINNEQYNIRQSHR
jgi:hydrogenase maturation protease